MTPQEAITELLTDKLCLMAVASHPSLVNVEEIDIAISALEKQIPKKPTIKKSVKVNAFALRCPNCEAVLQADSPCCRYCGQALDWSETE